MVYITLDPLKWSLDPSSLSWLQFSQRKENDDGRRVVDRDLAVYPGEAMVEASVLVVGAGAIGGVTAAKMTGEVRRVAVLDANEEHVERMRGDGLLLNDLGEERRVRVEAHADPAGLEDPFDFALITLKAPYLESALEPLLERGLVETFVSLGNGLVQERIAGIVGEGNLIWGTVEWGATNLGPGHLAQTTRGHFVIGEPEGSIRERTRILAEALGAVDEVRVTENIRGQVWSKLLVNSAFSGLGAVSGLLYGDVVDDPDGREVALALWREGYDVGLAQNLELEDVLGVPAESLVVRSAEDRERADGALEVAMRQAGATKASMLQDLERGVKTEVDVINGGVVEKGEEYGVETPLNSRVVELMRAMERGERRPDRDTFGKLRELA
jgi:2-dehydropantoate 2-reductase